MDTLAVLYPSNGQEVDIRINNDNFMIGRAKNASYDIKDISISRTQCIIQFTRSWTLCDKSNAGTWLNGKRLKQNELMPLKDGDHIRLGESHKFNYIFCTGGQRCDNSCKSKTNKKSNLDAELAQRRRQFEFNASLRKVNLEKSITQNQHDKHDLKIQQQILRENFNEQLQRLEERNRQLCCDLEKKGGTSGSNLAEEIEKLQLQLRLEKQELEESNTKKTSELASKLASHELAERELTSQNKALLEKLEEEKQEFERRLEAEKKLLEEKLADQLAEQQKLAAEKSEVEEALRRRIQDLEKMAHQEVEQKQQRKAEQEKDAELLSKEKMEFEERLKELQNALLEKEKQEKEKEKAFLERELELKAQEEQIELERKNREEKLETEFLAKQKELEQLESERKKELDRHKQEVTKELQDREAELKRKAEEHQKDLEAQRAMEQERLKRELEEKELDMKRKIEWEIMKLQEEKVAIETNIRAEQSKKEGENAKNLEKLQAELKIVKSDLDTTSNKRKLLEKELEEASRAKEEASKSELEAKRTVIEDFSELMESELQCSLCYELFVVATTLNCNHTFCKLCISNWIVKKRNEREVPSCPICRQVIASQSRSLVLDNFIDRMVENLSDDLKKRRKEIVEERQGKVHEANPKKKQKTAPNQPPVTGPLQAVNRNLPMQNIVLRQVPNSNVPAGANIIHLPHLAAVQIQGTNRGAPLLPPGPSILRVITPAPGQDFQQQRPQQLQQQLPSSAHPSSSAPNQMMIQNQVRHVIHQQGVRTRGGGVTRPPHAHGNGRGVQPAATIAPNNAHPIMGVQPGTTTHPNTPRVPPIILGRGAGQQFVVRAPHPHR